MSAPPTTPSGAGSLGDPGLGDAVTAALESLADLRTVAVSVTDGRVEQMLRAALEARDLRRTGRRERREDDPEHPAARAAVAVRVACAHLATREIEDAYFALRTAADQLGRPARG